MYKIASASDFTCHGLGIQSIREVITLKSGGTISDSDTLSLVPLPFSVNHLRDKEISP